MYAVIETGGKQYRVEVGTELEVELLDGNAGDSLNLERVLLIADGENAVIGRPVVANGSVAAEIVRRDRGEKTISFKYRPKARSRVKKGHRQELTILRISDIVLGGKSAAAEKAETDKARAAERKQLEETARKQAADDAALAAKLQSGRKAEADDAKSARTANAEPKTSTRGRATTTKTAAKPAAKAAKADAKATKPAAKAKTATKTTDKPASRSRTTKKDG
jgi:large subunit ribosomal protein L21